jgi:hypothetical protein
LDPSSQRGRRTRSRRRRRRKGRGGRRQTEGGGWRKRMITIHYALGTGSDILLFTL